MRSSKHLRDLDMEHPQWWEVFDSVPKALQTVEVAKIVGSVGHGTDFRPNWSPVVEDERDRLLLESFKIRGFDSNESNPSPITLVEVSGEYFVETDGHRRVSAAHRLKMRSIEAEVSKLKPKRAL